MTEEGGERRQSWSEGGITRGQAGQKKKKTSSHLLPCNRKLWSQASISHLCSLDLPLPFFTLPPFLPFPSFVVLVFCIFLLLQLHSQSFADRLAPTESTEEARSHELGTWQEKHQHSCSNCGAWVGQIKRRWWMQEKGEVKYWSFLSSYSAFPWATFPSSKHYFTDDKLPSPFDHPPFYDRF